MMFQLYTIFYQKMMSYIKLGEFVQYEKVLGAITLSEVS